MLMNLPASLTFRDPADLDGQCNRNCRVLGTEANAIRKMGHGI